MPSDQSEQPQQDNTGGAVAKASAARLARDLVRAAWKGTLATVARSGGHPYGSLVAIAAEPDGTPLMLLSGLAEHTKNMLADQRASILFDGTAAGPSALTGPRVSVVGRIEETTSDVARRRYLARHPDAAGFIGFADFKLYALRIEWAHLVAGFGRIVRLDAADMTVPVADAGAVIEAEPGILEHMNNDHAGAITLMASQAVSQSATGNPVDPASGAGQGDWRMIGCDPEGFDLAAGASAIRLAFPNRVTTPDGVRRALVAMVQAARANAGGVGPDN